MGGGGSKSLAPPGGSIHSRERRLSHVDTNPPPQSEKLVECPSCSRSFASDRVDKHVEVCKNLQNKKREVFDVEGQRVEGTLAEEYKGKFPEIERKSSGKWRKQHDEMIAAMKEAKKAPRPKTAGGTEIPVDIRM